MKPIQIRRAGPCFALLLLWTLAATVVGCRGPQPTTLREISGMTPAPSAMAAPSAVAAPSTAPAAMATAALPGQTLVAPSYWPTHGWRTSTPAEQGMDPARLAAMLDAVRERNLALHSLLVIRNGYIVSETYFRSTTPETRREIYSVTKSFVATLVGIAIDKGLIPGVDRPVGSFFPDRSFENWDTAKQGMTLENLLTMTTGLDWTEGDAAYGQLYRSRDWVEFVLDKPMRSRPGAEFNYCSGCSHVLSAILQRQAGMNTRDFAQRELFEPLGITGAAWDTDASGTPIGGWGLKLTPREMAKLGYLYLNGGRWDGRQIVSEEWVEAATRKHTSTDSDLGYGYQWWIYPYWGAYAALGRYGQTIFLVPDLDLVVVTTAQIEGHDPIFDLIDEYIVPAVEAS